MERLPTFPTRADFERGCMPDGSPLRFPSRVLYQGWGAPLPGKSNVLKKALKQDPPPDCGSIYTPEPGAFPHTGVPCPVPEQPDEALEAAAEQCRREADQFALDELTANVVFLRKVRILGEEAAAFLEAHPEIVYEGLAGTVPEGDCTRLSVKPGNSNEDAAKPERHEFTPAQQAARAEANSVALHDLFERAEEVARASRPVSNEVNAREDSVGSPASHGRAPVHVPDSVNVRDEDSSSATDDKAPASRRTPKVPDDVNVRNEASPGAPDDTGREARATNALDDVNARDEVSPGAPDGTGREPRATKLRLPSFPIPKEFRGGIYARLMAQIDLAARCAPVAAKLVMEWRKLARKLTKRAHRSTLKNRFAENRAVGVVKNQLLFLDDAFRDLGFGGWMPFRFPDQWLAFTSLSRKILAANGLITPKGPNHWRKFLEETPEVEEEELKLPRSLAPTDKYREISDLEECFRKARDLAKRDRDARLRFDERFAMGP